MKKIVRLTESDLTNIVKRVINELTEPTLGGCITNYKTANENWDAFRYINKTDDKFFLRRAYKEGSDGGEVNRIAIQKIRFIIHNEKKSILSSYSLPDQQGPNITAGFHDIIPYDEVKGNCSLIKQTLDNMFKKFINTKV